MNNNLFGRKSIRPLVWHSLFLLIAWLLPVVVPAQIKPIVSKGVTRAVVVGISDYRNEHIPDLRFAHADAQAFADFLRSPAGGKLPETNIQLLTNDKATQGNIVSALSWLMDESNAGDQAIIYFSGHGDMESLSGMSFLLACDASATAYSGGGAFPVYILQSIITRLSTQKQVQVLLITDACRSGKLAGSEIGGSQATSKVLSDQFANEAKILSCQPNEFSLEGTEWGGGRGVFSYYLLDGMRGLADNNQDMNVNLLEIGRFLEDKVPAATSPHSQIPMAVGNKSAVIAHVDAQTLAELQRKMNGGEPNMSVIAPKGIADTTDEKLMKMFEEALAQGHLMEPVEGSALQLFEQLKKRPSQKNNLGLLRRNLAAELQNEAQEAINSYLVADPQEMKNRFGLDRKYEKYPEYLAKSAELLGSDNFMYDRIRSREHYFRGLNLRLAGERAKTRVQYEQARAEQMLALQLDSSAVFAINELGHLALSLDEPQKGIEYFNKATRLSPKWQLPWSNLCQSYIILNDYDQAEKYGLIAVKLDSTFSWANTNLGVVYERKKDYKSAIYYIKRAIRYDPEYSESYFNLGLCYFYSGDFISAKSTWLEYRNRVPNDPDIYQCLGEAADRLNNPAEAEQNFKKALELNPNYDSAIFSLGELSIKQNTAEAAVGYWQQYLQLKPKDPEGYFQLARAQAMQQQKAASIKSLEKALELGLNNNKRISNDMHLKTLSGEAGFQKILDRLNQ